MTRIQAIARITAKLESLDDDQIEELLSHLERLGDPGHLGRPLSDREKQLVQDAKAEFAAGGGHSLEDGFAMIDARLASQRRNS
jgi:hypothetical protein